MGGNIFGNTRGVRREEIDGLYADMAARLSVDGLDAAYLREHAVGSTGIAPISNDVDIAIDAALFDLTFMNDLADRSQALLGKRSVDRRQLARGALSLRWPLNDEGVQIDFIRGPLDWLRFTHKTVAGSTFKGVFRTTALILLAKGRPSFRLNDKDGIVADVRWQCDLSRGLHREWRLRLPGQKLGKVDPDLWETRLPVHPPRFSRVGYIDDPAVATRILVGDGIPPEQIGSFEGLWSVLQKQRDVIGLDLSSFKNWIITTLIRTPLKRTHTAESLALLPVWADD